MLLRLIAPMLLVLHRSTCIEQRHLRFLALVAKHDRSLLGNSDGHHTIITHRDVQARLASAMLENRVVART
jgi:hypothetical protein